MEDQMSSIEMFISKLTNEVDALEDQKRNINNKIQALKVKKIYKNKQIYIFR